MKCELLLSTSHSYVLDHDRTTLLALRLMHDVVRERGDTINFLEGELHRTLALTTADRERMQLTTQTAMVEVSRVREEYRRFVSDEGASHAA